MNKVAIILETREHRALEFVLKNAAAVLPADWKIQVMHGKLNTNFVKRIIGENEILSNNNRIQTYELQVENITQKESSKLLLSPNYWHCIEGEHILTFQCDSILCTNSIHNLSDFEHFEYIGGYWGKNLYDLDSEYRVVMNGGLSLRKKSFMLDIIKTRLKPYLENGGNPCEDYFVTACISTIPTVRQVLSFSIDCGYQAPLNMEQPIGFHKPWVQNAAKGQGRYYEKIKQVCPEVEILRNLQ